MIEYSIAYKNMKIKLKGCKYSMLILILFLKVSKIQSHPVMLLTTSLDKELMVSQRR